jgi:hypothetical protein
LLHVKSECVLELQTEDLIVINEVKATELVPAEQQDLASGKTAETEHVLSDGKG